MEKLNKKHFNSGETETSAGAEIEIYKQMNEGKGQRRQLANNFSI
jgi:hypothetical protein